MLYGVGDLGVDMIEVLKMIHGIDKVILGKLFCIEKDRRTRKQFV